MKYLKQAIILLLALAPTLLSAQGVWITEFPSDARFAPASCESLGRIYLLGGFNNGSLNTLELYNPSEDTWTRPITIGSYTPRHNFTAVSAYGMIYIMGGVNGNDEVNVVEIYHTGTNTWVSPLLKQNLPRSEHAAVLADNGKIYMIGGIRGGNYIDTVEMFDPQYNIWSKPLTTGFFTPRRGLAASVVNGKIYVFGGGLDGSKVLNTLEVFDPAKNLWSTPITSGTFTARRSLTSSVLDGKIYLIGGFDGTSEVTTVEVFDPVSNTYSTPTITGTFTARFGHAAAVSGDKIYVMGGQNKSNNALHTNEAFAPAHSNVTSSNIPNDISLYPNPSNGIVNIKNLPSGQRKISVTNVLGKIVIELKNINRSDFTLDLSNLVPGTYYLKFASANSLVTKRVVKK